MGCKMLSKLLKSLLEIIVLVCIGAVLFLALNYTIGDVWDNYFDEQEAYRQMLILESKGEL